MTFWFALVAIGAALAGVAMSVAYKTGTILAVVLTLVGLCGVTYSLFDNRAATPSNPPDAEISK